MTSEPAASAALVMMLPDVRTASWADIAEIRQDKGLRSFRDKLRELESEATSEPMLQRAVREALLQEFERARPSWGKTALSATVNLITSPVPVLGQAVAVGSAAADLEATWRVRHHWTATLLRARKRFAGNKV